MSTGYNTPRDIYNAPNPNYTRSFLPANPQPIGSILPKERFPQNEHVPKLFQPLTIRGVEFKNRLWAVNTRTERQREVQQKADMIVILRLGSNLSL